MAEEKCTCGPTAEDLRAIYDERLAPRYLIQELTEADRFELEDETGFLLLERPPPLGLWIEMDPVGSPSIWVEQLGPEPGERGIDIPAASFEV